MRVLRNLMTISPLQFEAYPNNVATNPIESKRSGEIISVRAIPPANTLSNYFNPMAFLSGFTGEVTLSWRIMPEVDCTIDILADIGDGTILRDYGVTLQAEQWTTVSLTGEKTSTEAVRMFGIARSTIPVGAWMHFASPMINEGNQSSDIWVPAEEYLTPEQIATLPPYGVFTELKSF